MTTDVRGYLGELEQRLHLAPGQKDEILRELQGHLEDRASELRDQGVPPDEAARQAATVLGRPSQVAGRMYAVHSRASWKGAFLGATPHVAFAGLFALHLWTQVASLAVMLALATLVSLHGWRRGQPSWLYPWLGYSVAVPLLSGLAAAGAVGYGVWSLAIEGSLPLTPLLYLVLALYAPFALGLVGALATRVVQRDWLLASLTTMPLPLLVSWLLFVQQREGLVAHPQRLQQTDSNAALVFLALAITTAIFYRVGHRALRFLLLASAIPVLALFAYLSYLGGPSILTAALIVVACIALLVSPALLDSRLSHAGERTSTSRS